MNGKKAISDSGLKRFQYRFKKPFYHAVIKLEEQLESYKAKNGAITYDEKKFLLGKLKFAYEFAWKTMKDYLFEQGIPCFLPRKIIAQFADVFDVQIWFKMIEDFDSVLEVDSELSVDSVLNSLNDYLKVIYQFKIYFEKIYDEPIEQKAVLKLKKHKNHCFLDSYTFWFLTDYFKSNSRISVVKLYGSRAGKTFRKASDIDLFISGEFDRDEFVQILEDLNSLKHPYRIDVVDTNDEETKEFKNLNINRSIEIYNKEDFL